MHHVGTQTITTERLVLRRFTLEDADAMFRNWCSDDEVTRYLTWPSHASVDETREVLASWVQDYENASFYQWAIELRNLGEPIGSISCVELDEDLSSIEVGYCIGTRWWHQGIMTEALAAVIDFFFGTVQAHRVWLEHDVNNPRSGSVMQACGLTYEGTLRQADRNNQGIVDTCIYSILEDEWKRAVVLGG